MQLKVASMVLSTNSLVHFTLVFSALAITHSPIFNFGNQGAGFIGIGLLVMVIVTSFGGPTGPALNPARDLGPRIVHALFPLKHKGSSQWRYAWIPGLQHHLLPVLARPFYIKATFWVIIPMLKA